LVLEGEPCPINYSGSQGLTDLGGKPEGDKARRSSTAVESKSESESKSKSESKSESESESKSAEPDVFVHSERKVTEG